MYKYMYNTFITMEQCTCENCISEPDEDNVETFCGGLCCLSGCLCVSVGSLYFFVFIPASKDFLLTPDKTNSYLQSGIYYPQPWQG